MSTVESKTHILCEFESEVFGGFVSIVDSNLAQTMEEVLIFSVSALYGVLETNNLTKLLSSAKLRNFRIKTYDNIGYTNPFTPTKDVKIVIITDYRKPSQDVEGLNLL